MFAAKAASMPAATTPRRRIAAAWGGLAILCAVMLFAFVDRQVLSLVVEPMRRSLSISDVQFGVVQGFGLIFFAAIAAYPIGWLADRYDRRRVLAVCILVWASATAACGLSQNFWQLLLASAGIALGEAGLAPIIYSMIPEMFPEQKRAAANIVFVCISVLGVAAGLGLSGIVFSQISAHAGSLPSMLAGLEPWRLSFFLVAAPAPVFVGAVLTISSRNVVTERNAQHVDRLHFLRYLREHHRTIVGVYLALACAGIAFGGFLVWIPAILARAFGEAPQAVGARLGTAFGVGTLAGFAMAALAARQFRARSGKLMPIRVTRGLFALSLIPTLALLYVEKAIAVYVLLSILVAFAMAATAFMPTIQQDMAPSVLRARVIAVGLAFTAGAQGLSPVLIGMMSDLFPGNPKGLLFAIVIVAAPAWLLAAMAMHFVQRPFVRTVEHFTASATSTRLNMGG